MESVIHIYASAGELILLCGALIALSALRWI